MFNSRKYRISMALSLLLLFGSTQAAQAQVSWALDHIDSMPGNGTYDSACSGAGITIHVLGTGIFMEHIEFDSRAFTSSGQFDTDGEGTCWSSIASGNTYGVAWQTAVSGYDVYNGGGQIQWPRVIDALNYVTSIASPMVIVVPWAAKDKTVNSTARSLLDNLIAMPYVGVVAAAGDNSREACDYWPANLSGVLTVGATDMTDTVTPDTNLDSVTPTCVDVFAPGVDVDCADVDASYVLAQTMSGTGVAASLAAGVVAQEMACDGVLVDFAPAVTQLLSRAIPVVAGSMSSPDLLLQAR